MLAQIRLAGRIAVCFAALCATAPACTGSDEPNKSTTGLGPAGTTSASANGPVVAPPATPASAQPVPPPAATPNVLPASTPPLTGAGGDGGGTIPSVASTGGGPAGEGGTTAGTGGQDGNPTMGGSANTPVGGSGGNQSGANAGAAGNGAAGRSETPDAGSAGANSSGDVVPSMGCGAAEWPGNDRYTIDISGANREYILRAPDDYDPSRPYRLVVAFHWLSGTAENVANGGGTTSGPYYGLWDLAEGSTIFVAPQGIDNSWPSGNVPFASALIDRLTSEFCIDESRIFATGFSMGGSMSYAVACGLGSRIRGVAVYSGGPMSGCDPHDEPVAYFMSHGTQDSVCTYPGFGVPQIEDFAEVNGCTPRSMPEPSGNEPSCVDFEGCMEGYPARACIFVGDHTPSPRNGQDTWVPEEAWNFLSQF